MKHPVISKEAARKLLPPGACKRCVHYARCFPERVPRMQRLLTCSRCTTWSAAFCLTDHWGTPNLTPRPGRFSDDAFWKLMQRNAQMKV